MAYEFPVPGTDQSVDFGDGWSSAAVDMIMIVVSFLMAIGLGSAALFLYNNFVAPNTPDEVGQIDVMTEA